MTLVIDRWSSVQSMSRAPGRPGRRENHRRDVSQSRVHLACQGARYDPPVIDVTTSNLSNHAEVWMATGKSFSSNQKGLEMSTNRLETSLTLSTLVKTCCVDSLHESDVTLFSFRRLVGVLQFSVGRLGHSYLPNAISWPPRILEDRYVNRHFTIL